MINAYHQRSNGRWKFRGPLKGSTQGDQDRRALGPGVRQRRTCRSDEHPVLHRRAAGRVAGGLRQHHAARAVASRAHAGTRTPACAARFSRILAGRSSVMQGETSDRQGGTGCPTWRPPTRCATTWEDLAPLHRRAGAPAPCPPPVLSPAGWHHLGRRGPGAGHAAPCLRPLGRDQPTRPRRASLPAAHGDERLDRHDSPSRARDRLVAR